MPCKAWRRSISSAYRVRKNIVLEIMPAVAQLSNRKIDEDQAMNDLVAGFLKFRETGYQERFELFQQLAATALSVPSISALTSKKSRIRTADTAP